MTVQSDPQMLGLVAVAGRTTSRLMNLAPGVRDVRIDRDSDIEMRLHSSAPTTLCSVVAR